MKHLKKEMQTIYLYPLLLWISLLAQQNEQGGSVVPPVPVTSFSNLAAPGGVTPPPPPAPVMESSNSPEAVSSIVAPPPVVGQPGLNELPPAASLITTKDEKITIKDGKTSSVAPLPIDSNKEDKSAILKSGQATKSDSSNSLLVGALVPAEASVQSPVTPEEGSTGMQGARILKGLDFENEQEKITIEGVDTTSDLVKHTSGNWIEKKHFLGEIEEIVDSIKEKISAILALRTTFFNTRTEVDKELDSFYQHVGLDQGVLQDMINYALDIMTKEREHQGFLNKKERAFYDKVQSKQRVFEQLKVDVKAIQVLDSKIDEALSVVLKQINACNEYEGEVWKIYKTVSYELSEKEAEQNYLVCKAFLKDVENINSYLNGAFQSYFNELSDSVQTHTQNIIAQLDTLEHDGINLKKEADIFEKEEENTADTTHKNVVHEEHTHDTVLHENVKHEANMHDKKTSSLNPDHGFISVVKGYMHEVVGFIKDVAISLWDKITHLFGKKSSSHIMATDKEHSTEHLSLSLHDHAQTVAKESATHESNLHKDMSNVEQDLVVDMQEDRKEAVENVEYDAKQFEIEMENLKKEMIEKANRIMQKVQPAADKR